MNERVSPAEPTWPSAREVIVLERIGERADFFFRHGAKARVAYRGLKVASLVAGTAVTTAAALGGPTRRGYLAYWTYSRPSPRHVC